LPHLLSAAQRAAIPWKNGGGVTRVIDSVPGLGGVEFGWRASMAEVSKAGPFSCFPGIARLLCILKGRLALEVEGHDPVTLQPADAAYAFSGDAPASGAPLDGTVLDFNLMFDPLRFGATLTWHPAGISAPPARDIRLLLACAPLTANDVPMQDLDALRLPPNTALHASGPCWLALLTPHAA
jgi:environmental stress-induced protein Ves